MTEADRELQRARAARDGYAVVVGEAGLPIAEITLNGVRYVRADSAPAPGPDAVKPLPWPWTEATAEHILAISLERLEEIKRLRAEVERLKRVALVPATDEMQRTIDGLAAALVRIAGRDDDEMQQAKTLHWDMRGIARAALRDYVYPTVGTTAPFLSSMRHDLKVKKTPDVDE